MCHEVSVGAVCLGACSPLSASSGKQTRLFYDEDSSVDGGEVGNGFVAVNSEIFASLDFSVEGVYWPRGTRGCSYG